MAASDTTDSSVLALATLDDTRQIEKYNLNCVASPYVAKARKGGRIEQRTLKKCKQLFEYRHLPLLSDTWSLKF